VCDPAAIQPGHDLGAGFFAIARPAGNFVERTPAPRAKAAVSVDLADFYTWRIHVAHMALEYGFAKTSGLNQLQ
jgi:hypothetical protein